MKVKGFLLYGKVAVSGKLGRTTIRGELSQWEDKRYDGGKRDATMKKAHKLNE